MAGQNRSADLCICLCLVIYATTVQCQMNFTQTMAQLAASGKLPNATQTVAGYTAQTLCSGKHNPSHPCSSGDICERTHPPEGT